MDLFEPKALVEPLDLRISLPGQDRSPGNCNPALDRACRIGFRPNFEPLLRIIKEVNVPRIERPIEYISPGHVPAEPALCSRSTKNPGLKLIERRGITLQSARQDGGHLFPRECGGRA